jgi:membrane-bound serine protease (ClpP class)
MPRIIFQITLSLLLASLAQSQTPKVYVIKLDGAINPASADYIHGGIKQAEEGGAECLVIQLNTPGGLLKSTRVIVSEILEAHIPIVVYVAPGGAQAASAGVFVTMAANIAAMAPGTNIGAAHPVSLEGQQDSIMMEKATNDAAAFIRTISEKRKRNVQWAEDAVRKSLSLTENEALNEHVVDLIASNIGDLVEKIDNKKVETANGTETLTTKNAEIVTIEMSFQQKILGILSDPNIAYILFMLGVYGLLFELYNPGSILPGVVGVISLILAFYSLHTLPINYAGLGLIIFAVILFVLEMTIVSHGLLTIGGVVALLLGSLMLFNAESSLEFVEVSWTVISAVIVATVLFFLFAIGLGIKAQRRKPTTGEAGLIGEQGEAVSDLNPAGSVRVHGEIWSAESVDGKIRKGTQVVVTQVSNLKVKVRKTESI